MSTERPAAQGASRAWKTIVEMLAVFFAADFCVLAMLGVAYYFLRMPAHP